MTEGTNKVEAARHTSRIVHANACQSFENAPADQYVCLNCRRRVDIKPGHRVIVPNSCQARDTQPTGQPELSTSRHHRHARHS